jgi:hypothetical protein
MYSDLIIERAGGVVDIDLVMDVARKVAKTLGGRLPSGACPPPMDSLRDFLRGAINSRIAVEGGKLFAIPEFYEGGCEHLAIPDRGDLDRFLEVCEKMVASCDRILLADEGTFVFFGGGYKLPTEITKEDFDDALRHLGEVAAVVASQTGAKWAETRRSDILDDILFAEDDPEDPEVATGA